MQLDGTSFQGSKQSLPGLDITLSGNVAEEAKRTLTFDKTHKLHGAWYYRLVFDFPALREKGEVPELVLGLTQTEPPVSPFRMQ